jgi:transcriptional regulator with XRE-family HTH domain
MTDDELENLLSVVKRTGRKYSAIAKAAGMDEAQLSRYVNGEVLIRNTRQKTKDRLSKAFDKLFIQDLSFLDTKPFATIESHSEIEEIIKQKLDADFNLSAISNSSELVQGKQVFVNRGTIISSIPQFEKVQRVGHLRGYDLLRAELPRLLDLQRFSAEPMEVKDDIITLQKYTQKYGPLQANCNIQLAPLATFLALKEYLKVDIEIDVNHASGVELMHDVAKDVDRRPLDFFVCTTGAFNMTLIGQHGLPTIYQPVIPICYEMHEYLYDPRTLRGAPRNPSVVVAYDLSAGYEDVLVGLANREIPKVEVHLEDQFATLLLLFENRLDTGKAVNLWQPISTVLHKRRGWVKTTLRPYRSLLVLYQHNRFSHKSFVEVSDALCRLFVYEWNQLKRSRSAAIGLFWGNTKLKSHFLRGAGLNLVVPEKL